MIRWASSLRITSACVSVWGAERAASVSPLVHRVSLLLSFFLPFGFLRICGETVNTSVSSLTHNNAHTQTDVRSTSTHTHTHESHENKSSSYFSPKSDVYVYIYKVLETFLRDFGSYWHDSITQLLQICRLHIHDGISRSTTSQSALLDWDLVTVEAVWVKWTHCHVQETSLRCLSFVTVHYPAGSTSEDGTL